MRALGVVCFAFAVCSAMVYPGFDGRKPDMRPGEVVFHPKSDVALAKIEEMARRMGGRVRKVTRVLPIYLLTFEPALDPEVLDELLRRDAKEFWEGYELCRRQVLDLVKRLEEGGLVEYASPNHYFYIAYTPDDPFFVDDGNYLPGAGEDQYGFFIANAPAGWDYTTGDRDVLLCIIDSGVDVDHPDLADNIWVNPGEDIDSDGELYDYDDLNGVDDDGNGYVDDLFGYDFVGGNVGGLSDDPSQEDWNPDVHYYGDDGWGEPDPSCGDGIAQNPLVDMADVGVAHGTHCAGIAGAVMDNGFMFAGACGRVSIVPVRVVNPEGSGVTTDIVAGIEYAALIGADVASMSFGGLTDPAIQEACQFAYDNGVVLVAATGNDGGSVLPPASYPTTLAVGSFNSERERSYFSNYGPGLDVLGSGGDATTDGWTIEYTEVVWSTWVVSVAEAETTSFSPGDHTDAGEAGTSMACPQAAGLAALIRSVAPELSPDSVYRIIRNTAQDVGPPGWDDETGYGIIDFGEALAAATLGVTEAALPDGFRCTVMPNPANPTAVVKLFVPKAQRAEVRVVDLAGKVVCTLFDGQLSRGLHRFTLPKEVPAGTFVLTFSGDVRFAKKITIVR